MAAFIFQRFFFVLFVNLLHFQEFLGFESPSSLQFPVVENAIKTLNGIHLPLYAFDIAEIAGESFTSKPYLQPLFNELWSYYFANVTNNYEKTLQYISMKSDLVLNYYIDEFAQQIARRVSSVFYARYFHLNSSWIQVELNEFHWNVFLFKFNLLFRRIGFQLIQQ